MERAKVCQRYETTLVVAASGCLRLSTNFWDQGRLTRDAVAAKAANCLETQSEVKFWFLLRINIHCWAQVRPIQGS